MSKTLFNQNTFQSKNVTNSDDVQDLKVDTFKAVNLTATNITNAELQAATSGVASNLSALGNKQDELTASNLLNPNFIEGENDEDPVTITPQEFGALTGFDSDGGTTIQSAIDSKAKLYDVSAPLVKTTREVISFGENPILLSINNTSSVTDGSTDLITSGGVFTGLAGKQDIISSGTELQIEVDSNEVSALLATSAGATNFGLITGNVLNTELSSKQDNISVSNGIQISSNNLSLTGTYAGSFTITGTDFKIWNTTRGGSGTSDGRALVHTGSGTKATSVLRINYNSDYEAGTKIDSITGIKTDPDSNYDLKVNGNTDIGGVLSIDGYSNVKDALDSATGGGGTTYTALANGGLALSGSNEFSVDLTNTNATFEIPQKVRIEKDATPQLLIEPAASQGEDAEIEIRGARNASTGSAQARLIFANYDSNLSGSNNLGRIEGRVSNHTTNIGGLVFSSYDDGSSRTGQLTLSAEGNFNMGSGDTFQDTYKLKVTGDSKMIGSNYIKPQLRFLGYDKDATFGNGNWGNGSTQVTINSDRRVGDSFCSTELGVITFSQNGYYKISVGANTQSDGYNNRVSFMNYLRITKSGTATDYNENENYNFFGWGYIRNNSDGGHQSVFFEDYIYLASGDKIQPRHKLETGSDRNFNNTLPVANIDNYLNIKIERIYDEDPEV